MKKFFLILLLLSPILIPLGFDVTYYYYHPEEPWNFSELGWIWQNYHPESHNFMLALIGKDDWGRYVLPILSLKAALAGAIIVITVMGTIITVMAISALRKNISFTPSGGRPKGIKKGELGRARSEAKKFEYKRR